MKVIKISISNKIFPLLFSNENKWKIIKGLPEDAKLFYTEYVPEKQCVEYYFESEMGTELEEGQLIYSVEETMLEIKRLE